MDLIKTAEKFKEKLKNIKVCAFDIDGVLTNSDIWYAGEEVGFNRSTHTRDGYGLKMLMRAGIKAGVISGGDSLGVKMRFIENLKLDFCYLGSEDKREAYQKLLDMGYQDSEILFFGDEFFDTPLLKRAGFSVCPPHSNIEVKKFCDYVTTSKSGHGCAREVIDILRYAQGWFPEVPDFDGTNMEFSV